MYLSSVGPAGTNPGFALNSFVSQLKQPIDTFGLQELCHTETSENTEQHSIPFSPNIQ